MSGEARLVPKDAERNLELARSRRVLARFESGADPRAMAAAVQAVLGYVPPLAIALLAQKADLAEEQVLARIGEDEELLLEPSGRHRVTICTGTSCARWGGAGLARAARRLLGIPLFRTSADRAVHLEPYKCFGSCATAPNVRIDGKLRGAMTEKRFLLLLRMLVEGS